MTRFRLGKCSSKSDIVAFITYANALLDRFRLHDDYFDMFTITLSKIGQDKITHKKVMTLSNLAFLLGHPLDFISSYLANDDLVQSKLSRFPS
jgi:hypothetical protein